ncbi:MAG: aminoglycoside phosphotransferase family protein [Bacillota bacterium]
MVNIERIIDSFFIDGEFIRSECFGNGHINDTFAATFEMNSGGLRRYIFQRVNHNIFNEPEKLMANVENVTSFLRKKIIKNGGDPDRETLNLIKTVDGCYFKDSENDFWRSYIFIENATSYTVVEKPEHLYAAGKAFGKFLEMLDDYPAETLYETLKDFHNTRKRFDKFVETVEKDAHNRAVRVSAEIDFVMKRAGDMSLLTNLLESGKVPVRVTHNDTKLNNVLIDDVSGEGICIIDLDTVLPGLSLYDFGDAIRFGTNPSAEDERDLSKVWMDLNLFENFTKGYLEAAGKSLNSVEKEHLPLSAKIMTLECGMRFLTDFIDGDAYFKIHSEDHNLDRARTQFKIVSDIENKLDKMSEIARKFA